MRRADAAPFAPARTRKEEERVRRVGDAGVVTPNAQRFRKRAIGAGAVDLAERDHPLQDEALPRPQRGPIASASESRDGSLGIAASSDACARSRSLAGSPKYVRAAASTP